MRLLGYKGPWKDGFPTRFEYDDGNTWREATRQELSGISPETLVYTGSGNPKPAGEYADLRFPGNYPFLPGLAALRPVYVIDTGEKKSEAI